MGALVWFSGYEFGFGEYFLKAVLSGRDAGDFMAAMMMAIRLANNSR